ncbi:MAG: radical SAM family heme chaperone HemW [Chitinophagales bacterium]
MAGIYIHIPFCKQACNYCNFYFSTSLHHKDRLVDSILHEIALRTSYIQGEKIDTLYFGGGTPSILDAKDLVKIFRGISAAFDLSQLKEFTIEANPDDLTAEKVKEFSDLKSIGLNRFSVGIQSFSDADLVYMNRAHCAAEAEDCLKRLQDAGFHDLTIDLIYGTPTMSDEQWLKNITKALSYNIPHLSAYALTVEQKTYLHRKIARGEVDPVDDSVSGKQFEMLMTRMKGAGFDQYEISNFALPGRYAIHNSNYWKGMPYLGLGPSAHSFNLTSRQWNVSNNLNYINAIADGKIPSTIEKLNAVQVANEKIMTSLRTIWGLDLRDKDVLVFREEILHSLKNVDVRFYKMADDVITISDAGKFFADGIASELFILQDE